MSGRPPRRGRDEDGVELGRRDGADPIRVGGGSRGGARPRRGAEGEDESFTRPGDPRGQRRRGRDEADGSPSPRGRGGPGSDDAEEDRRADANKRRGSDKEKKRAEDETANSSEDEEKEKKRGDPDVEDALMQHREKEATGRRRRLRLKRPTWADFAAVLVVCFAVCCFVSFQVLCLYDAQCYAKTRGAPFVDPALTKLGVGVMPVLAILCFVLAPGLLLASDAAQRLGQANKLAEQARVLEADYVNLRRDRRLVVAGASTAVLFAVLLTALGFERLHRLRTAHFGASARRAFEHCDAAAQLRSGIWLDRGSCHYSTSVQLAYTRPSKLATAKKVNLKHLIYATFALASTLLVTATALALSLINVNVTGLGRFHTDRLRRRPRLVER